MEAEDVFHRLEAVGSASVRRRPGWTSSLEHSTTVTLEVRDTDGELSEQNE